MITEDQLEQLAIQWRSIREVLEHRTPNIEHRMEENLELPKIGAGIAKGINAAFRGWRRLFRAWNPVGDGTQGAALGWYVMPRWGGRRRVA